MTNQTQPRSKLAAADLPEKLEMVDDAVLWSHVLNGDTQAFEQVVSRYQNIISAVSFSIVGDYNLSLEVTQETFWQSWRFRFDLEDPRRLGAWLCGIARNQSYKVVRHEQIRKTQELVVEPDSTVEDPARRSVTEDECNLVWETLQGIPEIYREALVLFYREGHSVREAAKVLEVSEDTLKQRLSRGRNYLREALAGKVEEVLVRSRPSRDLTHRIMAGVATFPVVMKVGALPPASGAAASIISGAWLGLLGGFMGAACGLLGAWLGTTLPARNAPTMTERRLLESAGRRAFRASLLFTVFLLALSGLLFLPISMVWYFVGVLVATVVFVPYVLHTSIKANRQVRLIRQQIAPEDDPNPTAPKSRTHGKPFFSGRSFTSSTRLLGIPLLDIQVSPVSNAHLDWQDSKHAWGWVAIGDKATGVILAVGGFARGLFAIGGISLGIFSLGGLSLGLIAVGGATIGYQSVGGCAVGYDAVGGCAVAWNSAVGGAAMAQHVAYGGFAWSRDFAVGGGAYANEVNTPIAKEIAQQNSLKWLMDWYLRSWWAVHIVIIAAAFVPLLLHLRNLFRS